MRLSKLLAYLLLVAMLLLGVFYVGFLVTYIPVKTVVYTEPLIIRQAPVVEIIKEPEVIEEDPNNSVYPFNVMSTDWAEEIYTEGFRYYQIPEGYTENGGYFPEVVQVYLWSLCKERGLDYYTVVALIERESGYRWDTIGDSGRSFGYCQIQERWHLNRIEEENVEDLTDPYGNIRVATNFLQEIKEEYSSSGTHCILMVYNMGENTAKKLWKEGIYSSKYSRDIIQRAQEIKQELQA